MVIRTLDLETRTETVVPGSNVKWSPRWLPDGRYIVAQTPDFKGLYLFDCGSHAWRLLARGSRTDDAIAAAKFVHFVADTERGRALFRVGIGDGMVQQLAMEPENEYPWTSVAPDGLRLALRSVKIEEFTHSL